jgi:hypothetical protein
MTWEVEYTDEADMSRRHKFSEIIGTISPIRAARVRDLTRKLEIDITRKQQRSATDTLAGLDPATHGTIGNDRRSRRRVHRPRRNAYENPPC